MQIRRTILALLLMLGFLGVGLWATSYGRPTVARFAWPGAAGQTLDRGFLLLVDGRLAVVRQRITFDSQASRVPVREDFDREPRDGEGDYLAGDARSLGAFEAHHSTETGPTRVTEEATVTLTAVEPALAQFTWRGLGFASGVLAEPEMDLDAAQARGHVWARVIPLWPLAFLVIPALLMLAHRRGRPGRADLEPADAGESAGRSEMNPADAVK